VETKPVSVAFHYRKAPVDVADVALDAVRRGPASWPGVKVKKGKMVIELTVIDTDKGTAVERLRRQVGADTVLFVGDDVTDEDGFAVLRDHDVGVKVGAGHSVARYRVDGTDETAELLKMLAELRTAWLSRDDSLDGRAL